jgi:predicted alpha/beta superfamily hydrolase
MFRTSIHIAVLLLTSAVTAQNTARFEIKSLPPYHAAGSAVYIAGSFNGWNPQDEVYKFQWDNDGNYFINLKLEPGQYEFKITRGSWNKAECTNDGTAIPNRQYNTEANDLLGIIVQGWADHFPPKPKIITASKQVIIIDTAFFIPQLQRKRRVWVYLPEDYRTSSKRYPVLYMHDGQNVFDDATSYAGEWGVDEFMDTVQLKKCIIVAVDHGSEKRLNEYNPYDNDRFGNGEGKLYVDFLVKTLKPFIDKKYRTLKDKANTFIAGSSMGGLISMYAVLKYPKVFGSAGVYSPAFWVGPKIYEEIKMKGAAVNSKIYLFAGKLENESMVPDMLKAYNAIHKISKSKMKVVIRDEGKHNEATWRKDFPDFYKWICYPQTP